MKKPFVLYSGDLRLIYPIHKYTPVLSTDLILLGVSNSNLRLAEIDPVAYKIIAENGIAYVSKTIKALQQKNVKMTPDTIVVDQVMGIQITENQLLFVIIVSHLRNKKRNLVQLTINNKDTENVDVVVLATETDHLYFDIFSKTTVTFNDKKTLIDIDTFLIYAKQGTKQLANSFVYGQPILVTQAEKNEYLSHNTVDITHPDNPIIDVNAPQIFFKKMPPDVETIQFNFSAGLGTMTFKKE